MADELWGKGLLLLFFLPGSRYVVVPDPMTELFSGKGRDCDKQRISLSIGGIGVILALFLFLG